MQPSGTTSPERDHETLLRDPYLWAGLAIFVFTVVRCWTSFSIGHEVIYLLGSRRIADPTFLAHDFTWSNLPPTSFLYDHMLAPLWGFLGEFAIVNVGRFVWWVLFAAALTYLGKTLRLRAWTLVAGFALWMLWGQSFALCGSPFEGFQVKSLAYPLMLFALAFALRGRLVRSGVCAGLATAMHIVVGGWGLFALTASLACNRRLFPWRRLAAFALGVAPFVAPLLVSVALFHYGAAPAAERHEIDEIYVKMYALKCCDPAVFLTPVRAVRAAVIFALAPLVVFAWPERDGAKLLGWYLIALIGLFFLGLAGSHFEAYGFLKLFPFQLANSLPALFFFLFLFGWAARGIPPATWQRAGGCVAVAAAVALAIDRGVWPKLVKMPSVFAGELRRPEWGAYEEPTGPVCDWIRANTPKESVFVSPFVADFWPRAERAQVASVRQPPLDHRLIEWKERLVALNRSEPLETGGYDMIPSLDFAEANLTAQELEALRTRYGATHYLVSTDRPDLDLRPLYYEGGWYVYDLGGLDPASEASTAPDPAPGRR